MPVDCQKSTSGGKGNFGMFIERDSKICAAGLPTAQPDELIKDSLQHYLLKDEVDALIGDAIIPPVKPKPLPPLCHPIPLDKRYGGPFGDVAALINPPIRTKFQTLVDDIKDTVYSSNWKKPLGKVCDPVPMLPEGFDVEGTIFGDKTVFHGRLYDIIMPKEPYPDKTPQSNYPGVQTKRNYCAPPFNKDLTYGYRTFVDKRGTYARCCLRDDKVINGTGNKGIISTIQANFQDAKQSKMGTVLAPNNNTDEVPKGYAFGKIYPPENLMQCLTFCDMNIGRDYFRKCLGHLNTLRKSLSKRFLPTFFHSLYLNLKYFDNDKSGWLPKNIVYNYCGTKLIRFDSELIEPLLTMWNAYDGSKIEYKIFVLVINYREPTPEIPKISDFPPDCLDYRTTYTELVKSTQAIDNSRMAGEPSGRYFDLDYPITPKFCCKADRTTLPQESDMKSSLNPSVLTLMQVSHRDMYAVREPHIVRRVFEAAGEKFTNEEFDVVWERAKNYHSQGLVCYETFRKALENSSIQM